MSVEYNKQQEMRQPRRCWKDWKRSALIMEDRFMPNIGKYMINILKRQSNGTDMDRAWGWKSNDKLEAARCRLTKRRELNDLGTDSTPKL